MKKNFNSKRKPDKLPYRKVGECYLLYKNKLVAQDAGHYLSLPGGGIDKGESPEVGAKRELLEELGYEFSDFKILKKNIVSASYMFSELNYI